MSTEVVTEMAKRAHLDVTVNIFPWARALVMAEKDSNNCVYSTIRTPERETKYKWIGPLFVDNLALFARAERDIQLAAIEDARKYRVGTYIGSLAIPILNAKEIPMDVAPDDQANIRKLAIDRIDLWVASLRTGPYAAKRTGIVKVKPVLTIGNANDFQMYLACNPTMSNETVDMLNATLKTMHRDGTITRILKKYE
jgi:polar amino acid transport system substrate-binding protein